MKLKAGHKYLTKNNNVVEISEVRGMFAVGWYQDYDDPDVWNIHGDSLHDPDVSCIIKEIHLVSVSAVVFEDGTYVAFESEDEAKEAYNARLSEGHKVQLLNHKWEI